MEGGGLVRGLQERHKGNGIEKDMKGDAAKEALRPVREPAQDKPEQEEGNGGRPGAAVGNGEEHGRAEDRELTVAALKLRETLGIELQKTMRQRCRVIRNVELRLVILTRSNGDDVWARCGKV